MPILAVVGKIAASKIVTAALVAGFAAVSFGLAYTIKELKDYKHKKATGKTGTSWNECVTQCYANEGVTPFKEEK